MSCHTMSNASKINWEAKLGGLPSHRLGCFEFVLHELDNMQLCRAPSADAFLLGGPDALDWLFSFSRESEGTVPGTSHLTGNLDTLLNPGDATSSAESSSLKSQEALALAAEPSLPSDLRQSQRLDTGTPYPCQMIFQLIVWFEAYLSKQNCCPVGADLLCAHLVRISQSLP